MEKSAKKWVYLYRSIKATEIFRKLEKLEKRETLEILERIYMGYWPKRTFERYVDFVFKNTI